MPSRFAERFEALARPAFNREFGVDVTIFDGGFSVDVTAIVSSTTFETTDGVGFGRFETRDYLVEASKLILNGRLRTPERGMKIVEDGRTYTVTEPAGQPAFAYDDESQYLLRIHTVLTKA